jgi:hypothetical protein
MRTIKQKLKFTTPKMLSSRVEESDYFKLDKLLYSRDMILLQDFLNLVVTEYISGNIYMHEGKLYGDRDKHEYDGTKIIWFSGSDLYKEPKGSK